MILQIQTGTIGPVAIASRVLGMAILAVAVAAATALAYRWYTKERVPEGFPILLGLAGVAVYLNTSTALGQVLGGSRGLLHFETALVNTITFIVAGVAAIGGRYIGDRCASELVTVTGGRDIDSQLGQLVRTAGRVTTVTLPESIEDMETYDPVPAGTKDRMAGRTLVFPRGLTVAELRDRLVTRLKEDYGIGHVDVEITADGGVEYLAVGTRIGGIGPTLTPGTVAVAVTADPGFAASSGDSVQLWTDGEAPGLVASGELRGTAGDVVTVVVDRDAAGALDQSRSYRLVTVPTSARPEREFASLLRAADETLDVIDVAAGSELVGLPLGSIDTAIVAVRPRDGSVEAIPSRDSVIEAGDSLYAVARPEALRQLAAAGATQAEPSS